MDSVRMGRNQCGLPDTVLVLAARWASVRVGLNLASGLEHLHGYCSRSSSSFDDLRCAMPRYVD